MAFIRYAVVLALWCAAPHDAVAFQQTVTWSVLSSAVTWPGFPGTLNIQDNVPIGTVYQFACTNADGSGCTNVTWSFTNVPSFLTPGADGTLTTNVAPPLPHSSGTGTVTVTTAAPTITTVSWPNSPGTLNIPSDTAQGTTYLFTCTLSDNTPCVGRQWSFSNLPPFLTGNANGVLTTNTPPPLPSSSGTSQVQPQ